MKTATRMARSSIKFETYTTGSMPLRTKQERLMQKKRNITSKVCIVYTMDSKTRQGHEPSSWKYARLAGGLAANV